MQIVPAVPDYRDKIQPTSKLAVVTCAIGPKFQELLTITGPQLKKYADKCGADFIVLEDDQCPHFPNGNKFRVRHIAKQYDRVLYLDTDLWVKDCTPNMFKLYPPGAVYMHADRPHIVESAWLDDEAKRLADSQNAPVIVPECFNSGVVLLDREFADMWTRLKRPFLNHHTMEQSWIEINCKRRNYPIIDIDNRFNTQFYWIDFPNRIADAFIVHLASATHEQRIPFLKELQRIEGTDEIHSPEHWQEFHWTNVQLIALDHDYGGDPWDDCSNSPCGCTETVCDADGVEAGNYFSTQIAATTDDGTFGWGVTQTSGSVEFGKNEISTQPVYYHGFFRFTNITLPSNARIRKAQIEFIAQNDSLSLNDQDYNIRALCDSDVTSVPINLIVDTDNPRTATSIPWTEETWIQDNVYYTPDIACLITELINMDGWASGNDIMLLVETVHNTTEVSYREPYDYTDNSANAAELQIWYSFAYDDDATGGVVTDGIAGVTSNVTQTVSGGVVTGGESRIYGSQTVDTSGGAVAGGTATVSVTVSIGGGAVAGGTSEVAVGFVMQGGVVTGGTSEVTQTIPWTHHVTLSVDPQSELLYNFPLGVNVTLDTLTLTSERVLVTDMDDNELTHDLRLIDATTIILIVFVDIDTIVGWQGKLYMEAE